jgi:hypothetical protein
MGCSDHVAARSKRPFDTSNLVSARSGTSNRTADLQSLRSYAISTTQKSESFISARASRSSNHVAEHSEGCNRCSTTVAARLERRSEGKSEEAERQKAIALNHPAVSEVNLSYKKLGHFEKKAYLRRVFK